MIYFKGFFKDRAALIPLYRRFLLRFVENDCWATNRETDSRSCWRVPATLPGSREMVVVYFRYRLPQLPEWSMVWPSRWNRDSWLPLFEKQMLTIVSREPRTERYENISKFKIYNLVCTHTSRLSFP